MAKKEIEMTETENKEVKVNQAEVQKIDSLVNDNNEAKETSKTSRFSTKNEEVKKVTSYLGYGVHKVSKLTVFAGMTETKSGDNYDVIDFTFSDSKGATHTHRIFSFETIEDEEKMNKAALKAIVETKYIIEKALGKAVDLEIDSFDELKNIVKDTFKSGVSLANHEIKVNAVLNQKSGKYNAGFVTYSITEKNLQWGLGWFHNLNFDSPIKLGTKEIEDIRKANNLSSPVSSGLANSSTEDVPF